MNAAKGTPGRKLGPNFFAALALHKRGLKLKAIGRRLGVCFQCVGKYLRRARGKGLLP